MLKDEGLRQFEEIISTARSVRRRIDFERPIEREILLDCIECAVQAPTGAGGENWRFVVLEDAAKKMAVAKIYREVLLSMAAARALALKSSHQAMLKRLHEFPAMVFACMTTRPQPTEAARVAYYGSILPAAWSLMLALRARGIGSTWTTLLTIRNEEVARVLEMPADATPVVMLPIGYTRNAVLKKANRSPAHSVTYWNSWGH